MGLRSAWARWLTAANLRVRLLALWTLFKHPATPRAPKLMALLVLAYALSPIDLIPDFIPVLGQLDDLLLIPLGLWLVVRLTPAPLWQACLARAQATPMQRLPRWAWGALAVVVVWLLAAGALAWWWLRAAGVG
jgi:uncharacterized membrane protein YkvA (DUF1232 family)